MIDSGFIFIAAIVLISAGILFKPKKKKLHTIFLDAEEPIE